MLKRQIKNTREMSEIGSNQHEGETLSMSLILIQFLYSELCKNYRCFVIFQSQQERHKSNACGRGLVSLLLTLTDIFPLDMLICSLSIFLEYLKNKKPRYNRKINLWLLQILQDHYCYSKIKMVFLTNHNIREFFRLTDYKSFYSYNRLQVLRK